MEDDVMAIPHAFVEVTTPQTKTGDTNYSDISGAVIPSTEFVPGRKYLLYCTAQLTLDAINEFGIKALHGTTDFDGSEFVSPPQTASVYYTWGWFTVWTAISAEAIKLQFKTTASGQTVTADQITLFALEISELFTENTDWFFDENFTNTSLTTSDSTSNNAQVSFTPGENSDWLVFAKARIDPASVQDYQSKLDSTGDVTSGDPRNFIRADTPIDTTMMHFMQRVYALTNQVNTFTQKSLSNGNDGTRLDSAVFAINLSKFKTHSFVYTLSNIGLSTTNFDTLVQTDSITPSKTDNIWIGVYSNFLPDITFGGLPTKIRMQVDNVDQPPTQSSDVLNQLENLGGSDEMPWPIQTVESLDDTSHTTDLDAGGGSNPFGLARSRLIFEVELAIPAQTITKTFTLDAVLEKVFTKTFTLDAVLKKLGITKTFTLDAVLKKLGITKTFTLDAVLKKLAVTKTFTLDAVLEKVFTKTFTLDAVLKKLGITKTFTLDAVLKKLAITKTFTLDAVLEKVFTKTFTLDAVLKKLGITKTFTLDAILEEIFTKTFTLDAVLKKLAITKTFTLDAVLKKLAVTKTFTLDAVLEKVFTKTFTLDVVLKILAVTKTFTLDAVLKILAVTKTFTLDAVLEKLAITKTFTLDAVLTVLASKTFTLDAVLLAIVTKTFTLDAVLSVLASKTFTLDAVLKKLGITKTFTLDAVLEKIFTKTFTLDAVLKKLGATKTFTLDAVLKKLAITKTFTLDAVLKKLGITKTFTLDALLLLSAQAQHDFGDMVITPSIDLGDMILFGSTDISDMVLLDSTDLGDMVGVKSIDFGDNTFTKSIDLGDMVTGD